MSILICAIILDNLLYASLFGGSLVKQLTSSFGILLFIIIVAVSYGSALYLLSRFISPLHRQIKTYSTRFNWLYNTIVMAQYTSGVLIAIIILELILASHYYIGLLITTTAISFTLSAIIMAIASYRFLSWYKSSNKNATVLLYGVTFAVTAIGLGVIIAVNSSVILLEKPAGIGGLQSSSSNLDMSQNPKALILYQITYTPSRLGFVLYWIATALLLREYSRRLGRLKFWTIISLPLVSFLSASLFVSPDYKHSPVIYAPYPPFAAVAWSLAGLSSYLYSLGFYFSAISIAQDSKLRQSIRDMAIKESKLLDSIGTARMEQEIQKKVLKLAKEQEETLEEKTGVELHEWEQEQAEQENIQDYMAEVFAEVEKSRKKGEERL